VNPPTEAEAAAVEEAAAGEVEVVEVAALALGRWS